MLFVRINVQPGALTRLLFIGVCFRYTSFRKRRNLARGAKHERRVRIAPGDSPEQL